MVYRDFEWRNISPAKEMKNGKDQEPVRAGPDGQVRCALHSGGEEKIEEPVTIIRFDLSNKKGGFGPNSVLTRKGKRMLLREVPKEKREKWEKADPNYLKKGKKQMFFSRGYPKLMGDEHPAYTGNAEREFRKIAKEFMKTVELSSRRK